MIICWLWNYDVTRVVPAKPNYSTGRGRKVDVYPLMITLVYRFDLQSDAPSLGPGIIGDSET